MNIINQQPDINNLSFEQKSLLMFKEPRQPGDINLVAIVYVLIKDSLGEQAANNFINSSDIYTVIDKRPLPQRVMINKFFSFVLLRWRNSPISTPVWGVLPYLHLDGDVATWVSNIYRVIIPFLKQNYIL